jgi:hypothetical protein
MAAAAAVPPSSAVGPIQKRGSAASNPTAASVIPSVSKSADCAYQVGDEEGEAEAGRQQHEVHEAEQPHPASSQRVAQPPATELLAQLTLARHLPGEKRPLLGLEPRRIVRPLVEVAQRHEAERDSGKPARSSRVTRRL